jgi:hypothetical protein
MGNETGETQNSVFFSCMKSNSCSGGRWVKMTPSCQAQPTLVAVHDYFSDWDQRVCRETHSTLTYDGLAVCTVQDR